MEIEQNSINRTLKFNTNPGVALSFVITPDPNTISFAEEPQNGLVRINGDQIEYIPYGDFFGLDKFILNFKEQGNSISLTVQIKTGYSFRAKSHILSLLGDELIGSDSLAIFELVKNAYDADATEVKIEFKDLNTEHQLIIVEDDGDGMTLETLKNVWLEIGTDFKRGAKRRPSKKFGRISLGEKGVGRLAVHKLGQIITLETQPENYQKSFRLSLDWQKLMDENDYINETSVEIKTIDEALFPQNKGTRLIIQSLKKKQWERRELRDLARKINSIKSPFKQVKGTFNVDINAGEYQHWIDDIKSVETLLNDSIYYFDFILKKHESSRFAALSWTYRFTPPRNFSIEPNVMSQVDLSTSKKEEDWQKNVFNIRVEKNDTLYDYEQKHLLNTDLDGIGEITGRFYVYNLQSVVLRSFGQTRAIKDFVRDNSGVKIFRDGIRVYNYGETGDDWLGLDLSRVQRLGSHFSKNVTIGTVEITQAGSFQSLKEKTNREGFDENYTYLKFKNICEQVFRLFEVQAQGDREKLRDYLEGLQPVRSVGLPDTIEQLFEKVRNTNIERELSPLLRRVEKDYNDMRDVMLNSGMTGINLGIVFHEVDREVKYINADLNKNSDIDIVKQRVKNLIQLLEGFAPILRQNKNILISASDLTQKAKNINAPRFIHHKVIFSSPLISKEIEDFQINGPGNLLISALSNIIDNSIYWVCNKRELMSEDFKAGIYIASDTKNFKGPAIIIADNGIGFNLEPEDLIRPYRTTRPGGMGLGLYFVNLVMEMIGGKLLFPDKEELDIPQIYNGAVIALVFPQN